MTGSARGGEALLLALGYRLPSPFTAADLRAGQGHPDWRELLEVVVRKPGWVGGEPACGRKTFVQVTDQLPSRARCLTRLRAAVLEAVIASGRAVEEVATAFAVAWWTVQAVINTAVMTLPDIDAVRVVHLGIDEHRFRTVRFFRDPTPPAAAVGGDGSSRG